MNTMVRVVYRGISIDEANELYLVEMMEGAFPYFQDASNMTLTIWKNQEDEYCLFITWYDKNGNEYDKFAYKEFYSPALREDFMSAFQRLTDIPYTVEINHSPEIWEDFMWAFLNLVHIPTFLVETQDFTLARVLTIGFNDYDDNDSDDSQLYNELCEWGSSMTSYSEDMLWMQHMLL